jgi:hypothetical protein
MSEDPREREREFRKAIEDAALAKRDANYPRRIGRRIVSGIGSIGLILTARWTIVLILLFGGFFLGVFGWGIKLTEAYECSLAEARRSPVVIAELGEPTEAGFFAWCFAYRQEGSVTDTAFRTKLNGPKGQGTLRVNWYRAPVGSSLRMELEKDGRSQIVYSGPVNCR